MNPLLLYLDEDVQGVLAGQLRLRGIDAVNTTECGNRSLLDPDQLQFAVNEGRVIVTYNVSDFARLHHEYLMKGWTHAGIVVSAQRPVGDALRRLLHLATTLDADSMRSRLEYLSNW